jgi:hypothetical protein
MSQVAGGTNPKKLQRYYLSGKDYVIGLFGRVRTLSEIFFRMNTIQLVDESGDEDGSPKKKELRRVKVKPLFLYSPCAY